MVLLGYSHIIYGVNDECNLYKLSSFSLAFIADLEKTEIVKVARLHVFENKWSSIS